MADAAQRPAPIGGGRLALLKVLTLAIPYRVTVALPESTLRQ